MLHVDGAPAEARHDDPSPSPAAVSLSSATGLPLERCEALLEEARGDFNLAAARGFKQQQAIDANGRDDAVDAEAEGASAPVTQATLTILGSRDVIYPRSSSSILSQHIYLVVELLGERQRTESVRRSSRPKWMHCKFGLKLLPADRCGRRHSVRLTLCDLEHNVIAAGSSDFSADTESATVAVELLSTCELPDCSGVAGTVDLKVTTPTAAGHNPEESMGEDDVDLCRIRSAPTTSANGLGTEMLARRMLPVRHNKLGEDDQIFMTRWCMCDGCHSLPQLDDETTELIVLEGCGHAACAHCLATAVSQALAERSDDDTLWSFAPRICCPDPECCAAVSADEIHRALPAGHPILVQYAEESMGDSLGRIMSADVTMVNCPQCASSFAVKPGTVGELTAEAQEKMKRASPQAIADFAAHRVRCPDCSLEFCSGCSAAPFHFGARDCEAAQMAGEIASCRFCGEELAPIDDDDQTGRYEAISRCTIREGPELDTQELGSVEIGAQVEVLEVGATADGITRLRFADGWISLRVREGPGTPGKYLLRQIQRGSGWWPATHIEDSEKWRSSAADEEAQEHTLPSNVLKDSRECWRSASSCGEWLTFDLMETLAVSRIKIVAARSRRGWGLGSSSAEAPRRISVQQSAVSQQGPWKTVRNLDGERTVEPQIFELAPPPPPEPCAVVLEALSGMGFSEETSTAAAMKFDSVEAAIDWCFNEVANADPAEGEAEAAGREDGAELDLLDFLAGGDDDLAAELGAAGGEPRAAALEEPTVAHDTPARFWRLVFHDCHGGSSVGIQHVQFEVAIPALSNVCEEEDCRERASKACPRTLHCGHGCAGARCSPGQRCGEVCVAACLHCAASGLSASDHEKQQAELSQQCVQLGVEVERDVAAQASAYKQLLDSQTTADEYCSLCYTEALGAAPVLQLECGHLLHQHCIEAQIKSRWSGSRITFGFLECSLCRADLKHPQLEELTAADFKLRDKVTKLSVEELVRNEGEEGAQALADKAGEELGAFARRNFVVQLCKECDQPCCTGAVECGGAEAEAADAERPGEVICKSCVSLKGQAQTCEKHGTEHLLYKCRYCCNIATFECFGYGHFCADCHEHPKLGTLMNFKKKVVGPLPYCSYPGEQYVNKKELGEYPECPGCEDCPLGVLHPRNGVEFCIGCSQCELERSATQPLLQQIKAVCGDDSRYNGYVARITDINDAQAVRIELDACMLQHGAAALADGKLSLASAIAWLESQGHTSWSTAETEEEREAAKVAGLQSKGPQLLVQCGDDVVQDLRGVLQHVPNEGKRIQFHHGFGPANVNVKGLLQYAEINTEDVADLNLEGKIAVADRGGITFVAKALVAQHSGAIALIIVNNESGELLMGGDGNEHQLRIPVVSVRQRERETLLLAAATSDQPAVLNLKRHDGSPLPAAERRLPPQEEVLEAFLCFELSPELEAIRDRPERSAVKLQAMARAGMQRRHFLAMRASVLEIQRVGRGHLVRQRRPNRVRLARIQALEAAQCKRRAALQAQGQLIAALEKAIADKEERERQAKAEEMAKLARQRSWYERKVASYRARGAARAAAGDGGGDSSEDEDKEDDGDDPVSFLRARQAIGAAVFAATPADEVERPGQFVEYWQRVKHIAASATAKAGGEAEAAVAVDAADQAYADALELFAVDGLAVPLRRGSMSRTERLGAWMDRRLSIGSCESEPESESERMGIGEDGCHVDLAKLRAKQQRGV
jgi:hypothetical protein